mmetsp:Transcript_32898/g.97045  ORF Transcript_32898/g.97045 Transcript_32898/m.97045 type:complete len:467 (+) Transcript_32898:258-1658(+)
MYSYSVRCVVMVGGAAPRVDPFVVSTRLDSKLRSWARAALLVQLLGAVCRPSSGRRDVSPGHELLEALVVVRRSSVVAARCRRRRRLLDVLLHEFRYPLDEERPDHGMDVVVAHPLDEEGGGPVRRLDDRQQLLRVMERDDLVLGAVDEHDGTSDEGQEVDVGKLVAGEGAARFQDDAVHRLEGGVEDEAAEGEAVVGGPAGQVARRPGAEGAAVQDDVPGGDLEGVPQVGVGGVDVGVAVLLGWVALICGQAVSGVVVRQDVDAEALAEELAPRVDVAEVLGVGVGVQEGDAAAVVVLAGPGRGGILPGNVALADARRGGRTAAPTNAVAADATAAVAAVQIVRTSGVRVDGPRLGVPGGLDVEGRYSGPPRRVEPYDLGLLELRRRRGLEQERADGVSHDCDFLRLTGIDLTDFKIEVGSVSSSSPKKAACRTNCSLPCGEFLSLIGALDFRFACLGLGGRGYR